MALGAVAPMIVKGRWMTTRLERGLQILSILESQGSYNAHQLASKMGVTRRTIFRDIALLRQLGWPVHFDADSSAYTLHSGHSGAGQPTGLSESDRSRKFPSASGAGKVGDQSVRWDITLESVAQAVRDCQPLRLNKASADDTAAAVAMRPMELIYTAAGWVVRGRNLDSSEGTRWVSVDLDDDCVVVPLDQWPLRDTPPPAHPAPHSAAPSDPGKRSAEDAG